MKKWRLEFERRDPITFSVLRNKEDLDLGKCVFLNVEQFGKFVREILNHLKQNKCIYYNSVIGQLISIQQDNELNEYCSNILADIVLSQNIVVTEIKESVFLRKLKTNKFTDTIDYLILPNFSLWDHNFLVFLNKKFNSKKQGGLVNIWNVMQKTPLTQGVIKDLIQNKNGYAGQYLYSTFLNTSSFYANVQCCNGINEIVPPVMSVQRYYGRPVENVRVWNTRHPNISQLSTQFSRVVPSNNMTNWNVKIGLGTFVGANRDCDGDKEVITFLPQPNSLIELESMLYSDPKYSFICFDKNKLTFVSQQIYYLYKKYKEVDDVLRQLPGVYALWCMTKDCTLAKRFEKLLNDVALMFSSNMSTLLFKNLCLMIDNDKMLCNKKEVFELNGCFRDIINSGAKGSSDLLANTKHYSSTNQNQMNDVAQRALNGLNSHITSHGRVKFSGGDIYHNTVIFLNLFLHNNNICYKRKDIQIGQVCHLPDQFLFPMHLVDYIINTTI
ncbi:lef-9 [Adoxophyes orana granulovirus]|uniref:Late expression factor 9 n=4 Tax=Adoxophyes orana granulovirus TaxID=170617 RepID=Q7T9R5_GVAO|nr:lef-9 [Adoxophyes orana granulovirus]AAP85737.1 lef-9 [Adoxophyes orana granulovirus]AJA91740.1 late expression factor 9 [Adoxophyes orana granulovirus]